MKTTVEISDPLFLDARRYAAQEGTTLRNLIELGLRRVLADKKQPSVFRLRSASFRGNGLQESVRGAGLDRLREMAYEDHGG